MPHVRLLSSHSSGTAAKLEIEVEGKRLWIAFHTEAVVKNGWEPYDQPSSAAYVPVSRLRMHEVRVPGGVILVEKETREG